MMNASASPDLLDLDRDGSLVLNAVSALLDSRPLDHLWAKGALSPGECWGLLTLLFRREAHGRGAGDLSDRQVDVLNKAWVEADKTVAEGALPALDALLTEASPPRLSAMLRALLDVDDLLYLVAALDDPSLGKALAHLAASHIARAPSHVAGLRRFARVWLETLVKEHPARILWSCVLEATPCNPSRLLPNIRLTGKSSG